MFLLLQLLDLGFEPGLVPLQTGHLLLGPLGLEFAIKLLDALFQFNLIALELVILGSQRLNVSVRRRP